MEQILEQTVHSMVTVMMYLDLGDRESLNLREREAIIKSYLEHRYYDIVHLHIAIGDYAQCALDHQI